MAKSKKNNNDNNEENTPPKDPILKMVEEAEEFPMDLPKKEGEYESARGFGLACFGSLLYFATAGLLMAVIVIGLIREVILSGIFSTDTIFVSVVFLLLAFLYTMLGVHTMRCLIEALRKKDKEFRETASMVLFIIAPVVAILVFFLAHYLLSIKFSL